MIDLLGKIVSVTGIGECTVEKVHHSKAITVCGLDGRRWLLALDVPFDLIETLLPKTEGRKDAKEPE